MQIKKGLTNFQNGSDVQLKIGSLFESKELPL